CPGPYPSSVLALFSATPHAIQLSFGDANRRQRHDGVALRALQLDLRIDQIQDRRRAHVVLLLGELEVLDGGFQPTSSHAVALQGLAVGLERLVNLTLEITVQGSLRLLTSELACARGGDPRLGREAGEDVPVERERTAPLLVRRDPERRQDVLGA